MLYLWTKIFKRLYKNLNYWKIRDHCHYGGKYRDAAHSVCHLKLKLPHEISVIFHNGWVYDYYFSKKELANESEGQFQCLGENKENYEIFSIPIENEVTKTDKDGNGSDVTISYKRKLTDSARLMVNSLSNLAHNFAEEIHKVKWKNYDCLIEYENIMDNLIKCKCFSCKKDYLNQLDEQLKKKFKNLFKFLIMISINLFYC